MQKMQEGIFICLKAGARESSRLSVAYVVVLGTGGPHALVIRIFLSRGLDRLPSLLANQSHQYQNHSASRARSLAHPPRSLFAYRDRLTLYPSHPGALGLRPALAVWFLALLAGSRPHRRGSSLRRLGARAPRPQLEPLRHHQAWPRADHHRSLCPGPSPHLHRHSCRVSWHRDCSLPGARVHRFRLHLPRVLGQAPHGGAVDVLPVWGDVCHLCPTDRLPGTLPPLIACTPKRTNVSTAPLTSLAGEVRHLEPISGISQIPATGFNYKKHIEELKVPAPIEP